VDRHMGDPAWRGEAGHTSCTSYKQEKVIVVLLGGEEMSELFQHVGKVTDEAAMLGRGAGHLGPNQPQRVTRPSMFSPRGREAFTSYLVLVASITSSPTS